MTRQYVSDAEASFLGLMARRLLNNRREAAKREEAYVDLSKPAPLDCGVRAKLEFVDEAGIYQPRVSLVDDPRYSEEEMVAIASEIAGGPMKYTGITRAFGVNLRLYVRASQ